MQLTVRSIAAGLLAGTATYFASVQTMARTSAFVKPGWVPMAVWDALVIYGLGAVVVALLMHLLALVVCSARAPTALASFLAITLAALVPTVPAYVWPATILAWALGAGLASFAYSRRWPGISDGARPRRGTA